MNKYFKLIFKTINISLIIIGVYFGGLMITNAWTGADNLTAQTGDILTYEKWNTLVSKVGGGWNIAQGELSNPSADISITGGSGWHSLPGVDISNFIVGNSGKLQIRTSCTMSNGAPIIRISIDGGSTWKNIGSVSTVNINGRLNLAGELLYTGITPGTNINIQLELSNMTGTETLVLTTKTQPHRSPCRLTAISV